MDFCIHDLVKDNTADKLKEMLSELKRVMSEKEFLDFIHYKEVLRRDILDKKGKKINIVDKIRDPVIFYEFCDLEKMKILLDYGFDMNIRDLFGKSNGVVLVTSAEKCDYLLNAGIEKIGFTKEKRLTENEPILRANRTSFEKLKVLIKHGYDITIKDKDEKNIMFFIKETKMLNFLLKSAFSINETDKYGNNILFNTKSTPPEVFQAMIDSGADIYHKNKRSEICFFSTSLENMKILLNSGVDVNYVSKDLENCAFHCLTEYLNKESFEKMQLLIDAGINLNQINALSKNVLHYAKSAEMIEFLLKNGARPIKFKPIQGMIGNLDMNKQEELIQQVQDKLTSQEEKESLTNMMSGLNVSKSSKARI